MSDEVPREALVEALLARLFDDSSLNVFVILDGASIPDLLPKLQEEAPEHVCLYRGDLEPDLAECAPYLVRLDPESAFTRWVLTEGWGNHWGIFAMSEGELEVLRRHFRTFLMVRDPDGKQLYFRYYDPRVLRVYLPTCNKSETATVFGPVHHYVIEDENPGRLISFWPDKTPPRSEIRTLTQA